MTTYRRVHIESNKTITAEITEEPDDWSITVTTEEDGTVASAYLWGHTLEDAQRTADAMVENDHSCHDLCGNWTRVQSA